jgi:hypothetical protein
MNKYAWIALAGVFLTWTANANDTPVWMQSQMGAIEKPESMSGAEQDACVQLLLDEMNTRMRTSFTRENIAPIQMSGWDKPEIGFLRGGGFNVRIVASLTKAETKHTHIKPGRYADFETLIKMGDQPSLHVPNAIDGQQFFLKTVSDDGNRIDYDFVAHSDTAYSYLPLGTFVHIFVDVLQPDKRSPCPIEPHDRDEASNGNKGFFSE